MDAQVAAVAGRIGPAQLDRLVAETIKRFELASSTRLLIPEDGYLSVDPRHATLNTDDVHYAGTLHLEADLDLADGLDLDRALAHDAEVQKALGSTESFDVRRAKALGGLARTQTALDLYSQGHDQRRTTQRRGRLPAAREVVLHAHFAATTDGQATVFGPTGRLEEGQRLVLLDQVKAWCGDTRTKITIKPVIDLTTVQTAAGYAIPDRIREHVDPPRPHLRVPLVHPTSPWLRRRPRHRVRPRRRSRRPTTARAHQHRNLGALCRFHHRLKTHTAWTYRMIAPGVFEWTSPHGHRYRRDHARHHPHRPTRPTRATLTPPRTPPPHGWRGTGAPSIGRSAWTSRCSRAFLRKVGDIRQVATRSRTRPSRRPPSAPERSTSSAPERLGWVRTRGVRGCPSLWPQRVPPSPRSPRTVRHFDLGPWGRWTPSGLVTLGGGPAEDEKLLRHARPRGRRVSSET